MVGVQIMALRRDAGMTQEELARCVHVSASAIGMYEQGRRLPAVPILVALARVFDVTIDYLVTGVPCAPKDFDRSYPGLKKAYQYSNPELDGLTIFVLQEKLAYFYTKLV